MPTLVVTGTEDVADLQLIL